MGGEGVGVSLYGAFISSEFIIILLRQTLDGILIIIIIIIDIITCEYYHRDDAVINMAEVMVEYL